MFDALNALILGRGERGRKAIERGSRDDGEKVASAATSLPDIGRSGGAS